MKKQPAKPRNVTEAMHLLAAWSKYRIEMTRWGGVWTVTIAEVQSQFHPLGFGKSDSLPWSIHAACMMAREAIK